MGNPTEADFAAPPTRQDTAVAPPPYSTFGDASAAHAAPSYEAVPRDGNAAGSGVAGVSSRFPQSLNAYFPKMKLSKTFHLGEHADQLRFAVTMHSGLTSKPWLELHSGPNESDPIVATADNESKWGSSKNFVVQVIPIPESAAGVSSTSAQQDWQLSPQTIRIHRKHDWKHMQYPFSAEVGLGKDVRHEDFEWRHSRGGEVQQLDKYAGYGWKLVRLGSSATGQGGERPARSSGATSDGKEVVAAWSHSTSWSASKVFKFQFLESGATGVLGESFALIALASALKIWYVEFVAAISSGGGA
ncbi:hypothetical protein F4818DRAFT_428810 [Hypoxylon cercidicola]|nr:hypothetical protein F4818DRAFT_428810 [Hypoxylon cercidicola]